MAFDPYHKWLGIPPEEQPPNHYRLLGIAELESDADVIETAAEQRTLLLRTFQTGPDAELAEKLLNEVAAARVCLLDDKAKSNYDGQLKGKLNAAEPSPAPPLPELSAGERLAKPRSVVKWPTPWTQAHWFAAVGGALGTLLLVVCIWLLGSSSDTANNQLQQQIDALEEKLATAEEAAAKAATKSGSPPNIAYEYEIYSWTHGKQPVRMIHKNEGFCFLFSIWGFNQPYAEKAWLSFDEDGYWILGGNTHKSQQFLHVQAVAVKIILDKESLDSKPSSPASK